MRFSDNSCHDDFPQNNCHGKHPRRVAFPKRSGNATTRRGSLAKTIANGKKSTWVLPMPFQILKYFSEFIFYQIQCGIQWILKIRCGICRGEFAEGIANGKISDVAIPRRHDFPQTIEIPKFHDVHSNCQWKINDVATFQKTIANAKIHDVAILPKQLPSKNSTTWTLCQNNCTNPRRGDFTTAIANEKSRRQ